MRRKRFLSLAGASLASAAALPARAQSAPKILVGYWPISSALPFFAAAEMGFWKDAGVDVDLVKFSDQVKVTEALLAGRISATATGTGSTQLALAEIASPGLFKILAANLSSAKSVLDEIIVAKDAPYKKIADLKGKRIATGVGPQAELEARLILARNGVDTVPVQLAPGEHVAAVASGQVDAAYAYEPSGTIGRLNGTVRILEAGVRSHYLLGNADAPWYGGAAVITAELIKSNPAAVKKYVAGMRRGFAQIRRNLASARGAYHGYTTYDEKMAAAIPPISYTLYDEFGATETRYFQDNYDLFAKEKILARPLSVAGLIYKA